MWTQEVHENRLVCGLEQATRKRQHRVQIYDATAVSTPLLRTSFQLVVPLLRTCPDPRMSRSKGPPYKNTWAF
jgi:hypothetical protein